ncbi:hypothetical protein FN846DRAFT_889653 [Sphaerosporella brunnea]|uniref:Uncharacterized protein n=1 Tax=Sphaerosporella brunnea TaxID=1250544 RepID=A0A5J5EYZ6_9PEZI|nr:hypothetical protein FN846DRAFT_889653 [Sphaerosporella brunnea]
MTKQKICKHHHLYYCAEHDKYMRAVVHANLSTGWLDCGCRLQLRIGKAAGWWTKLSTAREELDRRRAEEVEADMSDEDELVGDELDAAERHMAGLPAQNELLGDEADVVERDEDFADFTGALVDTEGEVVENDDFAALLAKLDVVGNKAEDQSRFPRRAYGSLPAMGAYGENSSWMVPSILKTANGNSSSRTMQCRLTKVRKRFATWDNALLGRRVTSIACFRQLPEDKTMGWASGSNEITYGANAICRFDAGCLVSEFAPMMASLLADRDVDHPLVQFLRGQSGSGKTEKSGVDTSDLQLPPLHSLHLIVKKEMDEKLGAQEKRAKAAANTLAAERVRVSQPHGYLRRLGRLLSAGLGAPVRWFRFGSRSSRRGHLVCGVPAAGRSTTQARGASSGRSTEVADEQDAAQPQRLRLFPGCEWGPAKRGDNVNLAQGLTGNILTAEST